MVHSLRGSLRVLCKLNSHPDGKNKCAHGAEHIQHCITALNTSSYNEDIDHVDYKPEIEFLSPNALLMNMVGVNTSKIFCFLDLIQLQKIY